MTYKEEHKDLFTVPDEYYLAHCIASDLGMGAGIAVPMQKKFGLRGKILATLESLKHPTCIWTGRVFNLITKKKSTGKPTLNSLQSSIHLMKEQVVKNGIRHLAMPKIGCGLDRLQWGEVRECIQSEFEDVDVDIYVCVFK
jgi:O-acetyl-ADP-ribose deacetylase (regulator of RNase III)